MQAKLKEGSDRKRFYIDDDVSISDGRKFKVSGDDCGNSSYHVKGSAGKVKPGITESVFACQSEGFELSSKNMARTTSFGELKSSSFNGVGRPIISHAPRTGKASLIATFQCLF